MSMRADGAGSSAFDERRLRGCKLQAQSIELEGESMAFRVYLRRPPDGDSPRSGRLTARLAALEAEPGVDRRETRDGLRER